MTKFEKFLLTLFLVVGTLLLTNLSLFNYHKASSDSVIFADLLKNISVSGKANSFIAVMTQDFLFNKDKYLTIKAEDLSKLSFSIPNYKNTNFFHFHFYFILYLLAPLAFFIPSYAVICFFISLSFMGMVVLLYFFLRSKKINIWSSIIFCAMVLAHPVWNFGIQGQIYPDRFFLILGFALMWMLNRKSVKFRWLLTVSFLSAMIVEKTAIMVGLIEIGYSILYQKKCKIFILGLVTLLFGFGIVKFYLTNSYYSSFITLNGIINFPSQLVNNPIMVNNLKLFLLVNLPLLLIGLFDSLSRDIFSSFSLGCSIGLYKYIE